MIGMRIRGAEALCERLEAIRAEALARAAGEGMRQGLEQAAMDAREACPSVSGTLRASIEVKTIQRGTEAAGELRARAPYAASVELGTAKKRAQPFLYPAYKANEKRMLDAMRSRIRQAMVE